MKSTTRWEADSRKSSDKGTSCPVIELLEADKVQDGASRELCIVPQGNCRAMGSVIPFVPISVRL